MKIEWFVIICFIYNQLSLVYLFQKNINNILKFLSTKSLIHNTPVDADSKLLGEDVDEVFDEEFDSDKFKDGFVRDSKDTLDVLAMIDDDPLKIFELLFVM